MDKAYAYQNKKNVLMRSSSGGAFWGIVEAFFENRGGTCYGAKFDTNFKVLHGKAKKLEECLAFQGSKYVQSDMTSCFVEVKHDLKEGKNVLFTGTPCQVAAIKKYLSRDNIDASGLYTVDIVCHGTPGPAVWHDYIDYIQNREHSKLIKFSFRYKPYGWKGYPIYAEYENGKKYINSIKVSSYQNMFRKNLLMRESCFNCPYPGNFQSDLTISDFWGIELCMPDVSTDGGVSLILSHTEKGANLTAVMKNADEVTMVEVRGEGYKKYNHNLLYATERPDDYDKFWSDYKNKGLKYVLYRYGGENLKDTVIFYGKSILRKIGLADKVKKMMGRA